MEHLEKEAKEKEEGATSSIGRDVDVLYEVIGKKDYYGYVKGLGRSGVGVGHRMAYGKGARKSRSSHEDLESLKATLTKEIEEKMEARVQERVAAAMQAYLASLPMSTEPCKNFFPSTPHRPPTIEEPKKCLLAVNDEDGNLVVVAEGTAYPYGAGVQHSSSVLPDHYKVSIETPYKEHASVALPVPAPDGTTLLGQAKDYFVQWHVSMVLFEDKMEIASQSKERVASCNPINTEESGAGLNKHSHRVGTVEDELTEECSLLHVLMTEEEHDTIRVPLKAPLFYFQEDKDVWVTSTDISEFMRGACANVSLIHVYIRYLYDVYDEFISAFQWEKITFLCPQRISAAECRRQVFEVMGYVKNTFKAELQKKEPSHFILAPYHENNHWILLAIDLRAGVMFQFNPAAHLQPRQWSVDNVFQNAYKTYRAKLKGNSNLTLVVKDVECAQQIGGTECGYYVMKYMYEIVTSYSECRGDLQKEYVRRSTSYSEEEINEGREQWAKFFRINFLLS